jgi:hypothetical protein
MLFSMSSVAGVKDEDVYSGLEECDNYYERATLSKTGGSV